MQYEYDRLGRLVDGVVFRFNKGDNEITIATLTFLSDLDKLSISIIWNDYPFSPREALGRLNEPDALEIGYLAVIFRACDYLALRNYLEFLREKYPVISSDVDEVGNQLFGTVH